ncbi:MAG: o-succinylbenzoate synthase [Actinomycetota bacterium]|nr:o-succinylbenzoate synthase [Actinomycetota bacterium]
MQTGGVKLEAVELRRVGLPLVAPFRTSFGIETHRDALVVRVIGPGADGWGECVSMIDPLYSSEYTDGVEHVVRHHLLPRLFALDEVTAASAEQALEPVKGHRMAKAALQTAVLDAELREAGVSLAVHLGGVRDAVDAGVSVGIMSSIPTLLDAVAGYVAQGYKRVKLKIEPGWDIEPVRAVRELIGGDMLLQVDANTAYTLDDADHLAELDAFDLLLIEQPLPEDDLLGHAELATRIATPVCLDESISSARDAATAIRLGAAAIINIKPGRVGGYHESRRIHDVCVANGIPVWCGGMLETGIGRAANVALASLPGFTLPGDTSASDRYFTRDITAPFELIDGQLRVPTAPGIGVDPIMAILDELTTRIDTIRP